MDVLREIRGLSSPSGMIARRRLRAAYAIAFVLPFITLWFRNHILSFLPGEVPGLMLFLFGVAVSAYLGGLIPGLIATGVGALLADYFLILPVNSFRFSSHPTMAQWVAFVINGSLISIFMEALHRERRKSLVMRTQQAITLASISDAVITTNENGEIEFLNPEAERLTGWTRETAEGRNAKEVFRVHHEITGESMDRRLDTVLRKGATITRAKSKVLTNRDGQQIPVDASASPIRSMDGSLQGVVIIFRDATEARQEESALRQQMALRERLASIAATAPGAILSFLLRPDGTNCFPYASPAIEGIYALKPEDIAKDGSPVFALVHPNDAASLQKSIEISARDMTPWHAEFRIRNPRRGEIWVDGLSVPQREPDGSILWQGIITDVTTRKRAEEALRDSQAQLQTAVEAAGMGVWTMDLQATRLWLDDTSLKFWGLEQSGSHEWDGDLLRSMVHPDDIKLLNFSTKSLVRQGTERSVEFRVIRPDGNIVWLSVRGRIEYDASGKPVRQVGVAMDVTGVKRAEDAQMRSQKLEALGTLSGGIAHDFNNILLAITENARLARLDMPQDHLVQDYLEQVEKGGERATELVKQILAFSRPPEEGKQPIQLAPLVQEVIKLVRATTPASIRLEAQLPSDLPAILGNSSQIYQVLINLVTNAVHAIENRSGLVEMRLAAEHVDEVLAASVPGLATGDYVRLSVRDDGRGMDSATLERLFDPFFTTKSPGQGTGLGLAVVHGIIKGHQGAVSVYSEPGRGSVFNLYLPVAKAPVESRRVPVAPAVTLSELRVMYVDDEEMLVMLAERALERLGHRVTGFTEPRVAIGAFKENPESFDIVVTDLTMPGISGFELVEQLRAIRPDMPIVMTSGYIRPSDEERAITCGVKRIILKPTSMEELGHALDQIIRESRAIAAKQ